MKIYENKPIGYCPGVSLAIAASLKIQHDENKEVFTYGHVVHNEVVTSELIKKNIKPIEDIKILKRDDVLIFSAHGSLKSLKEDLLNKGVRVYETTCPIVENIHNKIIDSLKNNKEIIFVGKKNHSETNSVLSLSKDIVLYDVVTNSIEGNINNPNGAIDVYCQTTIGESSFEIAQTNLKKQFPNVSIHDTRCEEVKKRQEGILSLPKDAEAVFVIGGTQSSNTKELYNIAKRHFYTNKIYLFTILEDLDKYKKELKGLNNCALISGSSTPVETITKVKSFLFDLR